VGRNKGLKLHLGKDMALHLHPGCDLGNHHSLPNPFEHGPLRDEHRLLTLLGGLVSAEGDLFHPIDELLISSFLDDFDLSSAHPGLQSSCREGSAEDDLFRTLGNVDEPRRSR
jgi:hypothetical protein